jgi:uncharacterized Zn finger protein
MIKCPSCGSLIQEMPEICECGYNFREAVQDMSYSEKVSMYVAPSSEKQIDEQVQDGEKVIITDIQMPFGAMVRFMVMWAIASIPAAIIIGIVMVLFFTVFTAFITGIAGK